jgi:hypothetical protein
MNLMSTICMTFAGSAWITLGLLWAVSVSADECHPSIDLSKPQYIVGYGSLMETASKGMTEPQAGTNLPVSVTGFQRSWNTHGVYPTTFLGVQPSAGTRMVAALYRDFPQDGKLGADARERSYCRLAVDPAAINMFDGSTVPVSSQIWVYATKPELIAKPDKSYPITQSYVDIFIAGCLQLQARVSEPNVDFVEQCIRTTDGWSKHWVNDRIYPRRPFMYQPNAWEIDQYLIRLLPDFANAIPIE